MLEIPNQRRTHKIDIKEHCLDNNSDIALTQFLPAPKNQMVD